MKSMIPLFLALTLAASVVAQQKPADQTPGAKKEPDCGCESTAPADAFATVDGVKVSPREIDQELKSQLDEVRTQIIEGRNRQLQVLIDSRLIDIEAKKLGLESAKLVEKEVTSKIPEPTTGEALSFYEQNKDRLQGTFNEMKPTIQGYLRDQAREQGIRKYAARL